MGGSGFSTPHGSPFGKPRTLRPLRRHRLVRDRRDRCGRAGQACDGRSGPGLRRRILLPRVRRRMGIAPARGSGVRPVGPSGCRSVGLALFAAARQRLGSLFRLRLPLTIQFPENRRLPQAVFIRAEQQHIPRQCQRRASLECHVGIVRTSRQSRDQAGALHMGQIARGKPGRRPLRSRHRPHPVAPR